MKTLNFKLSFVFAAIAIYLSYFAFSKEQIQNYYLNSAYFLIFIIFGLWVYKVWTALPSYSQICKFIKSNKFAILLSGLITILIFVRFKSEIRILADETNLLSISKSMTMYSYNILNIKSEITKNYTSIPISSEINKRPLLFPFILSIIHLILGYNYINAFILNGLCTFCILFCLFYLISSYFNKSYGYLSILLLSSYPIIVVCATSAGFEIFNLCWSLILIISIRNFFIKKSAIYAELVIYTSLLFAQTRYESSIIIPVVIFFIWKYLKKDEFNKLSFIFSIFPLFCINLVWLNKLTYTNDNFEFGNEVAIYSIKYFIPNLLNSIKFFLGIEKQYGIIEILSIISLSVIFIQIIKIKQTYQNLINNKFLIFIFMFYILHLFTRFCFIGGNIPKSVIFYRLAIIFIPIYIIMTIYYLYNIEHKYNLNKNWFVIYSIFLIIFSWSNFRINDHLYLHFMRNYLHTLNQLTERNFTNKTNYILISPLSNFLIPLNYNSIEPNYFNFYENNFKNDIAINKTWQYAVIIDVSFIENGYEYKGLKNEFLNNLIVQREFLGGNIKLYIWNPNNSEY